MPSVPVLRSAAAATRQRRGGWVLFFVAFFVVTGSWSLATPPYASPDEPSHVFRAAAVVRGEILLPPGDVSPGGGGVQEVPRSFLASAQKMSCFAFQPDRTADCATPTAPDGTLVRAQSGAARYNPFYYALVGWPSLLVTGDLGLYLMRLVSAALCSAALATAMTSALRWGRSRLLGVGLVVGVTPMTTFLCGVVNPNGFEIAAAACVWTSGLALLLNRGDVRNGILVRRLGLSGAALALTRGLSPLWLAIALLTLGLVVGLPVLRQLLRRRRTFVWAGVVLSAVAASAGWTLLAGADQLPDQHKTASLPGAMAIVVDQMPYTLQQYVGTFGWTDAYSPGYSLIVWSALLALMVGLSLLVGRRSQVLVLLGLLATVFWLPVLLEASQYDKLGLFWQARYMLPVAVGVPLLTTAMLDRAGALPSLVTSRLAGWVLPLALSVHLACFCWALRRYQVGYSAPLPAFRGPWAPELGSYPAVAVLAVGLAFLGALVWRFSGWREDSTLPREDSTLPEVTVPTAPLDAEPADVPASSPAPREPVAHAAR